jgi:hypothetical protein
MGIHRFGAGRSCGKARIPPVGHILRSCGCDPCQSLGERRVFGSFAQSPWDSLDDGFFRLDGGGASLTVEEPYGVGVLCASIRSMMGSAI